MIKNIQQYTKSGGVSAITKHTDEQIYNGCYESQGVGPHPHLGFEKRFLKTCGALPVYLANPPKGP